MDSAVPGGQGLGWGVQPGSRSLGPTGLWGCIGARGCVLGPRVAAGVPSRPADGGPVLGSAARLLPAAPAHWQAEVATRQEQTVWGGASGPPSLQPPSAGPPCFPLAGPVLILGCRRALGSARPGRVGGSRLAQRWLPGEAESGYGCRGVVRRAEGGAGSGRLPVSPQPRLHAVVGWTGPLHQARSSWRAGCPPPWRMSLGGGSGLHLEFWGPRKRAQLGRSHVYFLR